MSQKQYLKTIEREIQRINRIIDIKILRGEEYKKEALDHKLLLKKIRYQNRQSFFKRLISSPSWKIASFFQSSFHFLKNKKMRNLYQTKIETFYERNKRITLQMTGDKNKAPKNQHGTHLFFM